MMVPFAAPDLVPALPELTLAILGLLLILLGAVSESYKSVSRLAVGALLSSGVILCALGTAPHATFGAMFVTDTFAVFMKLLVLSGSAVSVAMAAGGAAEARIMRFEYPVLIVFSTIGMMLMISATDLMSLYVSIELQSLPLYVLAAFQRDTTRSTEAGLKYFVLGALSSGLLLYGMSLIYGYTGTTSFELIGPAVSGRIGTGMMFGMVLLLCGLAFKISAVPFHMWAPDVYEGAPTSVTAFFAIAPKIAALALLARILSVPLHPLALDWKQILVAISFASMALGAVAAIGQKNIKRLLAYSSIGHMGYALMGLAAVNQSGLMGLLVYAAIYAVSSAGVFAVVLMMKQNGRAVEGVSDLAGLARTQPGTALAMAIMMFSMAGIPPAAGFFGKLFVFQAAVKGDLYWLAVGGVLASVIGAYYYLRIIKIMYFDEAPEMSLDRNADPVLACVMTVVAAALVFFIVLPGPLLTAAEAAAKSLLPG